LSKDFIEMDQLPSETKLRKKDHGEGGLRGQEIKFISYKSKRGVKVLFIQEGKKGRVV